MQKFLNSIIVEFNSLPSGIKRLIIVCGTLAPIILAGFITDFETDIDYFDSDEWIPLSLGYMLLYWIVVMAGIWTYKGFRIDNQNKNE